MKKITITINAEAKVKVETSGFAGAACKDATREIEKALGAVVDDTPTKEMYERAEIKNRS